MNFPSRKYVSYFGIFSSLFVAGLLLSCFALAAAGDDALCSFAGKVELNGASVDDGTTIVAIVEGREYSTATPTGYGPSTYSVSIWPGDGEPYPDGTPVRFKVNGYMADQTGILKAGGNIRLDLTASTSNMVQPPPVQRTNSWLITGLVLACIAQLVVLGLVVHIVRTDWHKR